MSKFQNLKVGDVLSETQYYEVVKTDGNRVQLLNDEGENIVVNDQYVDHSLASSDQFDETKKVTKTELAEIFLGAGRTAMTVQYNKQVDPKDVQVGITGIYDNIGMGMTKEAFGKEVKKALNLKGEERIMVGRHYGTKDVNGRVHFIDMKAERKAGKTYDTRQRLVDPRTINYVIVGNVKYQVK